MVNIGSRRKKLKKYIAEKIHCKNTWLYSNGFMVFWAYPLWFIWLTSIGLYGLFPMVYGSILMV